MIRKVLPHEKWLEKLPLEIRKTYGYSLENFNVHGTEKRLNSFGDLNGGFKTCLKFGL